MNLSTLNVWTNDFRLDINAKDVVNNTINEAVELKLRQRETYNCDICQKNDELKEKVRAVSNKLKIYALLINLCLFEY